MTTSFRGMTVVEAVVAIAVFVLICGVAVQTYQGANALTKRAADKTKALWLAEEGIEATRSIRDENFGNLSNSSRGLLLSGGKWIFSGSSDTTEGYVRTVAVTLSGADTAYATSTVSWSSNGATSTVALATRLTNWRKLVGTQADHLSIITSGAYLQSANPALLTNITLVTDGVIGTTTISQIMFAWTPNSPTTRRLQQIYSPNAASVYTGSIATGGTATLTTPITMAGAVSRTIQFRWNATMVGKTFTTTLIMSDGSSKVFTITNPPTAP